MDKTNIVINNYFSYDIPSPEEISVKEAYKKGFIRGFNKINPPTSVIHAKWILTPYQNEEDNMNGNYHYKCSNCNYVDIHVKDDYIPYCWHCGAKMEDER